MAPTHLTTEPQTSPLESVRPGISWGAIIGGALAAVAVHIGLSALGLASGLAMYEPFSADADDGTAVAWTTIIGGSIIIIAALFFGGWVAGRLTNSTSWLVSGLHGLLAWATNAVVVSLLLATAVGVLAGGAMKALGTGVGGVAQGVAQAVPEVAKIVAPNWDSIRADIEAATKSFTAANAGKPADLAGRSRMMDLLGSAFSLDRSTTMPDADKRELEQLIVAQTGLSPEAAASALTQWQRSWSSAVERFNTAMMMATDKAKRTTIAAKRYTAALAAGAFAMMLLGAVSAFLGAIYGHTCRFAVQRHDGKSFRQVDPVV